MSDPWREAMDTSMVGLGLATACAAHGVTAITAAPQRLRFAFRRAWEGWPRSGHFPDMRDRNIVAMLHGSEHRRVPTVAAWTSAYGGWSPQVMDDFDHSVELLEAFDPVVTWEDWTALARAFLAGLSRGEVEIG